MPSPRVLLVDRSRESRDLLAVLLARRGAEVLEARDVTRGAAVAAESRPDLIVLDVERPPGHCPDEAWGSELLAAQAARNGAPIVVIGRVGRAASPLAAAEFVTKPYHYGTLVRRIGELLERRA